MATMADVQQQVATLTEAEQRQLRATLPPPEGAQIGRVWYLVIGALFILALACGAAAFALYWSGHSDNGATFLGVTTTIVGGLVGLLAPSPVAET